MFNLFNFVRGGVTFKKKILTVVILLAAILVPSFSYAAPRFLPGQTLNPGCLPTDADCAVVPVAASGANADITSLANLVNSTTTNATSTNFYTSLLNAISGFFTNLVTTNFQATNATTTNATTTNLAISGFLTATNALSTTTLAGGLNVAGVNGLTVLQNGNVGIGTTTSLIKLSIVGTSGAVAFDVASSSGASILRVSSSGNVDIGGISCANTKGLCVSSPTDTASLSSELLTNGNFSGSLDGWTVGGTGTGWLYSLGALHNSGNNDVLTSPVFISVYHSYLVSVQVSGISDGTVTLTFGNMPGSWVLGNGANYYSFVGSTTGSQVISLTPSSSFNGKIVSVSVKEVVGKIPPIMTSLTPDSRSANNLEIRAVGILPGLAGSGFANNLVGPNYDHSEDWGAQSIAIGYNVLQKNVTGFQNTAIGAQAMQQNVTGYYNTAYGQGALYGNTNGHRNTAVGMAANQYNDSGSYNSSLGYYALYNNSTGNENTAIGTLSLFGISTGSGNTGVGFQVLYNATSTSQNTAMGYKSSVNTTGDTNSSFGWKSLYTNTSGSDNTAIGASSLALNTTGRNNTALGENSLGGNVTGLNSTAVGYYSLASNTAGNNTAVGGTALQLNTTGNENTALGISAGRTNVTANANTTGSHNTFVGAFTGMSTSTQQSYLTVIGAEAVGNCSNCIILGRSIDKIGIGTTTPAYKFQVYIDSTHEGHVDNTGAWAQTSDQRLKKNILTLNGSLDKVMQLRGVTYDWKADETASTSANIGFIAQEVEQVFPQFVSEGTNGIKGVEYGMFTPVLVQAIKEQQGLLLSYAGASTSDLVVATSTDSFASTLAEPFVSAWDYLTGKISSGVKIASEVAAEKVTALVGNFVKVQSQKGFVTIDRTTGEKYCIYVDQGIMRSEKGECDDSNTSSNVTPATITSSDQTSSSTDNTSNISTTTPATETSSTISATNNETETPATVSSESNVPTPMESTTPAADDSAPSPAGSTSSTDTTTN